MNSIFSFLKTFSLGGIVIGALYILVPEKTFKKPIIYILSLTFVLLILLSVPRHIDFDYSFTEETVEENIESINEQTALLTIKSALSIAGIDYSKLEVDFSKDPDGKINYIYVKIQTKETAEKIKEALNSENIKVSVINE